jgi:plasmid stabilization system protein ParE
MKVFWTSEARARLLAIHTYIAEESPLVASDVVARLVRRSQQLAVPPLLGRRLPEYPNADLRELLVRPFRIIYVVKAERIEIVTVKHYRQNLPRTPDQLNRRPRR